MRILIIQLLSKRIIIIKYGLYLVKYYTGKLNSIKKTGEIS